MKLAVFALLLVVLPFQAEAKPNVCDTLVVSVIGGDVPDADGELNPPDAYVKVIVDGQTKRTREETNKYEPSWHEKFTFTNVKSDKLVLELWEDDDFFHGGDDHLATCHHKLNLGWHGFDCGIKPAGYFTYTFNCLKG